MQVGAVRGPPCQLLTEAGPQACAQVLQQLLVLALDALWVHQWV